MFKPVEKHNLDFRHLPHSFIIELDKIEIETDSERKEKLIATLLNKSEILYKKIIYKKSHNPKDFHLEKRAKEIQKRAKEIQNLITYLKYKRKH
jgi:hypothetical protein